MTRQNIDRQDRADNTGLTELQRDAIILQMHRRGATQRAIAKKVGMSNSGIKYAIDRLTGKVRGVQVKYEPCDGCWNDFPRDELKNQHGQFVGFCKNCR
jgi:hypothetical protein